MRPLCLTPEELYSLTGKKKFSAQRKTLRAMGIDHLPRPDGSIAVDRGYYEALTAGTPQGSRSREQKKTQPQWDVL